MFTIEDTIEDTEVIDTIEAIEDIEAIEAIDTIEAEIIDRRAEVIQEVETGAVETVDIDKKDNNDI